MIMRLATGLAALFLLPATMGWQGVPARAQTPATIPEGRDFATRALRDPWDMSEFTDISQYLNDDGQFNLVQNVLVANGVFSGQSTWLRDPHFHVLHAGYRGTLNVGKVGARYPISSSDFQCLYAAMRVNPGQLEIPTNPDQFQVFWFADASLNNEGATWGRTYGIQLYPEAGAGAPVANWKLYRVNLATQPSLGTAWTQHGTWQSLRIDPTNKADVDFSVDWVRLTDCRPVNYTVTWPSIAGAEPVYLWLQPAGTTRNVLLTQAGIAASTRSHSLDTQGFAAGTYQIRLSRSPTTCCSMNVDTITIAPAPIATFERPSFTSGVDYATETGNAWDMADSADTPLIVCASSSFLNGLLTLDTPTYSDQPWYCQGGTVADPQVFLRTPVPSDTSRFRFLTFRMHTEGPVQRFGAGMMVRWVWVIQGASGRQGYECWLVSNDIPYDVGWQTYSVDLKDDSNGGTVIQTAGDCPTGTLTWSMTSPVLRFRLDPNENITGSNMHQELDWVRLTAMDEVKQGTPFPVQISLNVSPSQLTSSAFYYTTDPAGSPQQHSAALYAPVPSTPGRYSVYLPLVLAGFAPGGDQPGANGVTFYWDTATVTPGTYYICTSLADAYNQATYCSEAPVVVSPP
jgi:hypothetical protein